MIHTFFVCGMYGHMINYVLNHFACYDKADRALKPKFDGSMHHGHKTGLYLHCDSIDEFAQFPIPAEAKTSAPFYPLMDAKFSEVVNAVSCKSLTWPLDKKIVLTSQNLDSAALNILFQYHKVANGVRNAGLEIFYKGVEDSPFKAWNQNYTGFSCLHRWEFREWFSIAWKGIVKDWMIEQPDSNWLVLDNRHFIDRLPAQMRLIFAHCNLPWKLGLDEWLHDYQAAQQYILEEFALVDKVCYHVVNQQNFYWKELNVIAESLIQSKLRDLGYEIRCQDLDRFPTDIAALSNLLYSVEVV